MRSTQMPSVLLALMALAAWLPGASIGVGTSIGGLGITAGLPLTVAHSWDAYALDLEVFDTTKLGCHWDVTWSVGFRYVEYEEVRSLALNVTGVAVNLAQLKNFEGIGMTSALELRRR
jgi:hypothetical protein